MSADGSQPPQTALVGYKSPPAEHRFQKGKSGNPKGRPPKEREPKPERSKGQLQLDDVVMIEALRPIQVRENDQVIEMPMIQAVMRSLGVQAVKGHHRSQLAIASMVRDIQSTVQEAKMSAVLAAWEYKKHWREVFESHDRRGIPRPEPIPHPDDIVINEREMTLLFNGPSTHDEKAKWDHVAEQQKSFEADREECAKALKRPGKHREYYQKEYDEADMLARLLKAMYPDEQTRRRPGFDIHDWRERQPAMKEARERVRKRGKSAR